MNKTGIDYLDYTWNPTKGCSPISPGCKHCWAKAMAKRLAGMGVRGYSKDDPFAVVCSPEKLEEPMKIKKPSRIGVSFMGDLFHDDVPFAYNVRVWTHMVACEQHQFMLLTKRPKRMAQFVKWIVETDRHVDPNIHLGVTVCNQKEADEKIPILLSIPAAHRFVSIEPMLGPIDIEYPEGIWPDGPPMCCDGRECGCKGLPIDPPLCHELDLVILGGESGPGARPMHPDWVRSVRDQCQSAGVAFHFKQWGEWAPCNRVVERRHRMARKYDAVTLPEYGDRYVYRKDLKIYHATDPRFWMARVGKQKAGRLLDGREHNGG